ncbi:MAG: hypothetical protein IJZ68_09645 [Bacteroidaceae bacterium]|jgi:hypothetical protein|nr:hypothetical protein [Bacteroidaceae bacterium]
MNDIEYMVEHIAAELTILLMENRNLSFQEAIDTIYTSDTYMKLRDKNTGLYYQSPKYVYSFLEHELLTGVMG